MSRRVLITGATGYIGRYAVPKLIDRGYDVHALSHRDPGPLPGVTWHSWDILKKPAGVVDEIKPSHLLHLAWYAEHGKFWNSPLNIKWTTASASLFKSFIDHGGRRAVMAGTCAEYDWTHSHLVEQTTPSNPKTVYGLAKNLLRQTAEIEAAQASVSLAWARIFFLYGGPEHPGRFVPSILNSLRAGQSAIVQCGSHVRDFMHVEDVASALVTLLDSSLEGTVNVASGQPVTLGDIGRMLAEQTGSSQWLCIKNAPGSADNPPVLTADVSRLKSTGFKPRYTLAEGLRTLI